MNILTIESSCDETAAAVIRDGTEIVSSVVASSTLMHEKWGGIVPEVAAREQFSSILPVLTEVLSCFSHASKKSLALSTKLSFKEIIENNIDAIAVTVGPGLVGSLLIGVETAKTIAYVTGKPIIPVNHVLAHMYANFIKNDMRQVTRDTQKIIFPAISLVVSGGHTELFLMKNEKELQWLGGTIDDAAGEAFDKSARLLGFGHGGGAAIQKAAEEHDLRIKNYDLRIKLPRPLMHDTSLNFSFSGLKTAILREVNKLKESKQPASTRGDTESTRGGFNNTTTCLPTRQVEQLAFEVQEAITDVLVSKTLKAVELHDAKSIMISGGVASNTRLREKFQATLSQSLNLSVSLHFPTIELCTDNAAFIGSYAFFRGKQEDWHTITAIPDLSVEE